MPLAIAKLLASYFNCMKVTEMRLTPWLQLVLRKQSQNFCPKFPFCTCFSFFFFSPPLDSCFRDKLQPSEYLKCVSTISCSWFEHSLTWQQKAISISRFLSTMVQSLKKSVENISGTGPPWTVGQAVHCTTSSGPHLARLSMWMTCYEDCALLSLYKWGWQLWKGIHITEGKPGES